MRHYQLADYLTQGYLAAVALLVVIWHGAAVPAWGWFALAHAAAIASIHTLIQKAASHPEAKVLQWLRGFYPLLLYTALYRETGELNHMIWPASLDPFFIELEARMFGGQPSLEWRAAFPQLWVSELFYACYFSFYVMIAGLGVALWIRNRAGFLHYVTVMSFVFYVCYTIFLFLPVSGPQVFYVEGAQSSLPEPLRPAFLPEGSAAAQSGWFFRLMALLYAACEVEGAAFPSSHVAVAVTTLFFSFRYLRSIRFIHLIAVIGLCFSTVYCGYHYAVDVLGGWAAAALLIPLGNKLFNRFPSGQREAAPATLPLSSAPWRASERS